MYKVAVAVLLVLGLVLAGYPVWKPAAKRIKWFVILTNIAQDSVRRMRIRSDQIGQSAGLARSDSILPAELARIRKIYGTYLRYAGWQAETVAGKRVIELGPGML